jgi:hypothetical protein
MFVKKKLVSSRMIVKSQITMMMMMMPFNCSYRNKNEPSAIYPSLGYSPWQHGVCQGQEVDPTNPQCPQPLVCLRRDRQQHQAVCQRGHHPHCQVHVVPCQPVLPKLEDPHPRQSVHARQLCILEAEAVLHQVENLPKTVSRTCSASSATASSPTTLFQQHFVTTTIIFKSCVCMLSFQNPYSDRLVLRTAPGQQSQ